MANPRNYAQQNLMFAEVIVWDFFDHCFFFFFSGGGGGTSLWVTSCTESGNSNLNLEQELICGKTISEGRGSGVGSVVVGSVFWGCPDYPCRMPTRSQTKSVAYTELPFLLCIDWTFLRIAQGHLLHVKGHLPLRAKPSMRLCQWWGWSLAQMSLVQYRRALNGTRLMARAGESEKLQTKKLRSPDSGVSHQETKKQQKQRKTASNLPAVSCVYR